MGKRVLRIGTNRVGGRNLSQKDCGFGSDKQSAQSAPPPIDMAARAREQAKKGGAR